MKYTHYCSLLLTLVCFTADILAQVPVREEPHHKPVLENDYVRLLDVHLNAGDTTQYHIHATPSVILFLSKSTMGAQLLGKTPAVPNEVSPGGTLFVDYGTNPITHRVYNSGNNVFHVMDIELVKKRPSADSCTALQQNDVQTTITEKLVRVYKVDLNMHHSLNIIKSSCAYLLVCVSGEINAGGKQLQTGDYVFFNPNTEIEVSNHQNTKSNCVLLQLK